ncbi:MAG TPA: DUF5683 domain-containing protein [Saprospiraceae bacterium]|nr:DUF5683 domain-containing protein [Saprospiraceae bacterium]
MNRQWSAFLVFYLLLGFTATAQVDSLPEHHAKHSIQEKSVLDTLKAESDADVGNELKPSFSQRVFGEYPKPRTALILSLVIPGAGQAYNKKYWKVPLVYGALGYMGWRISENRQTYQDRRDAYIAVVTGDSSIPIAPELQGLPANSLRILRDNSKKQLESNWIFLVLTYALNGIDAYVDAHLLEFDVSEDLSLNVDPALLNNLSTQNATPNTLGLKISMSF